MLRSPIETFILFFSTNILHQFIFANSEFKNNLIKRFIPVGSGQQSV